MQILDTLQNLVSGLFTAKDKASADTFVFAQLSPMELEAAYRGGGFARKIVDIPPFDMTRAWRNWQAEAPQIEAIEAEEKRLDLRRKVKRAMQLARVWGGAAIIIGFGDADPSKPAPTNIGKGGIKFLTVVPRRDLSAGEIDRDPMSPFYGEPTKYVISSRTGGSVDIHPSRVIRFIGAEYPDILNVADCWGDSVIQVVADALRNAELGAQGTAALIHEAKVDVIRVPNMMAEVGSAAYRNLLIQRFTLANTLKSFNNTLLLDKDEEWDRKQTSFSQLPEVIQTFLSILAGVSDIPATRLLGRSPDGQNSTGDSDIRNYYDRLSAEQENELRPRLARIDEPLIISALGARPAEVHYRWAPLWQPTEVERANIAKTKAETTQIYVNAALLPSDALARAVANQLVEDGTYPGLEAALDDAEQTVEEYALGAEEAAAEQAAAAAEAARAGQMATDAAPRTLYVKRDVVNAADIVAWAKGQGFTDVVPDLHVTIAYSTAPVDWFKVGTSWTDKLEIAAGGPRQMDRLGPDGKYLALLITAPELVWRNREMRDAGASWDWPDYQPHISIQIGGDIDLAMVKPYQGRIVLGPEIFEEIRGADE